ncbi:DUF2723 domain-containing protein [candidate division GN15 bacterium]|nr:DUF2723 domain-containing protein [candidate division GN15 bacterium]
MPETIPPARSSFDRTNAVFAALVFIAAFIVYAMTVHRSFSFWDCGEFIACSYILGIPHPPGTPLFILIGRVFSMIPFVEDISYRVNYLSVISSCFTALFSYLIIVRIVGYFFGPDKDEPSNRWIAYVGGVVGALFVAFSATNWANSVETEVYGPSLALMTLMLWLTLRYFEERGTSRGLQTMVLVYFIALLGVGIHMTPFLVVPVLSIFYMLNKEATTRDWIMVCAFIIIELLLIIVFANGRGGFAMFGIVTIALGAVLLSFLYRKINWAIAIAIVALSSLMLEFSKFIYIAPAGMVVLIILGSLAKRFRWNVEWKVALAIVVLGIIGFSVHLYIPIRSAHQPRIDQNNPSRDYETFKNYLDRKQYGQESMVERMFDRRGKWENQLGRHPHMGYWSYFEEQYSDGGWNFVPFLALGLIGMYVAIRKRAAIGMPFFTLFIVCSLGLVLYMNFADGTQYDGADAYLEVRNRDYFFTPAFVFFGIAMGLGVSGIVQFVRDKLAAGNEGMQRSISYASTVLILLPAISLADNYHENDRSNNHLPYNYAANLLDTCDENAILFTAGDNDTFPLWCLQEVYDYRKDVRIVNLSLLNTDWYVWQMKDQYDVPISLSKEQIWWYPVETIQGDTRQPRERFRDRPRGRMAYLQATPYQGRVLRVADMMVDEIVLENRWQNPIYFSSQPYAESPLNLRDRATSVGLLYRLDREPPEGKIDLAEGLDLYRNTYRFEGFEDSEVHRDENATGIWLGVGMNGVRIFDALNRSERGDEAKSFMRDMIDHYPEYWQSTYVLAEELEKEGDSVAAMAAYQKLHDTLTAFLARDEDNLFYMQDLGMVKVDIGTRTGDEDLQQAGVALMWQAFEGNPNSSYAFRKLVTVLSRLRRVNDMRRAAAMIAEYKINLGDPFVQQVLQATGTVTGTPTMPGRQPGPGSR